MSLALGDTVLLRSRGGALGGFALCHTAPLVEGRVREELRVLKLVLAERGGSRRRWWRCWPTTHGGAGARRVAMRVQGDYVAAFERLMALGARVLSRPVTAAQRWHPTIPLSA